jgi:hypothetical protein
MILCSDLDSGADVRKGKYLEQSHNDLEMNQSQRVNRFSAQATAKQPVSSQHPIPCHPSCGRKHLPKLVIASKSHDTTKNTTIGQI